MAALHAQTIIQPIHHYVTDFHTLKMSKISTNDCYGLSRYTLSLDSFLPMVGTSIGFLLCSTSGFRSIPPIIGFACHFTRHAYKRLSSTSQHDFLTLCLHVCWACSLSVVFLGLFPPNLWVILVSSVQLSPSSSLFSEWGFFGYFLWFHQLSGIIATYRRWPLFFCSG